VTRPAAARVQHGPGSPEAGGGSYPAQFYAKKSNVQNDAKPKLGSGQRFARLERSLSKREGVTDPAALAASIGRKRYGAKRMAKWAAKGRKG
jgi:hypothetical protein